MIIYTYIHVHVSKAGNRIMSRLAPVTVHSRLAGQSAELLVKGPVTSNLSWLQLALNQRIPSNLLWGLFGDWIYEVNQYINQIWQVSQLCQTLGTHTSRSFL